MSSTNTRRSTDARADDLYTTPHEAVHHIMQREGAPQGSVLDAGCGTGHISEVVKQYNDNVTAIDLHDHGYGIVGEDFTDHFNRYDTIISNPPFKKLTEFIQHALLLANEKVIVFCRMTALESANRYAEIYSHLPPSRIYLYVKRINCAKGGVDTKESSAVFYCWLVWDVQNPVTNPVTHWIDNR